MVFTAILATSCKSFLEAIGGLLMLIKLTGRPSFIVESNPGLFEVGLDSVVLVSSSLLSTDGAIAGEAV